MKLFNIRRALSIFLNEVRYVLRDRTTIIMMVVLPIITYPVVAMITSYVMLQSVENVKAQTLIVSLEHAPRAFTELLAGEKGILLDTGPVSLEKLKEGRIHLLVSFSRTFETSLLTLKSTAEVLVYHDEADFKSRLSFNVIKNLLERYRSLLTDQLLEKHGAPPVIAKPFVIVSKNIAPPGKIGGFLVGRIVPFLIIIFAAVGAFYPAIDVTAMEKERGTLETLLLTPASTAEIMFGKFLSVFLLTLVSVFLNIISIALTATHGLYFLKALLVRHTCLPSFEFSITPAMALLILIMMLPVSAIFSSLMMVVALFARNFKEAQNYMTPLLLLFTIPPMVVFFPGFELNISTSLIPLVNISLLFRDMMIGRFNLPLAIITLLNILFFAFLSFFLAVKAFSSEKVLFRTSQDILSLLPTKKRRHMASTVVPLAYLLFVLELILLYYLGSLLQSLNMRWGLILTEIILIFVPSYLFIRLMGWELERDVFFRPIGLRNFIFLLFLGFSGASVAAAIGQIVNFFYPAPAELLRRIKELFSASSPEEFLFLAILGAILPGICEELLFRGALLRAFLMSYTPGTAVFVSSLLFATLHMDPFRFLPILFIGFYIGLATIYTGSIFSAFLLHFLNNSLAIIAVNIAGTAELAIEGPGVFSIILFIISFSVFRWSLNKLKPENKKVISDDTVKGR